MKTMGRRRAVFLTLCEEHSEIKDDPFNWGTFKMFWSRDLPEEKVVEQFLQWKRVRVV